MTDPHALAVVISLAARHRDTLARGVATANRLAQDHAVQLEALEHYLRDYLVRPLGEADKDGARLRNYEAFIARLESAIVQQRGTLAHHRARAATLSREHTQASIRVKSLETLALARAAEARRAVERIERKVEDEQASRVARRGSALGVVV